MSKKILIAEDDADLLFLLCKALNDAGYEVQCLNEASPIVNNLEEWPSLFILDKEMKFIDGIAICKYLKLNKEARNIPIVMISGGYQFENKALKAGADCFISKPFNTAQLLKVIDTLIARSQP